MSQRRSDQRWEHPTYRYAYVREHRGFACTVIHGSYPRSTGYRFVPAARKAVMKILEQRLAEYNGVAPTHSEATRTCEQLFQDFAMIRFPKLTAEKQAQYTRYFAYVPAKVDVTNTDRIRRELMARVAASHYAQNTRRALYTRVRTVFAFGIDQGWLRVNPVHKDMVPDAIITEPTPYADDDIQRALASLHGRHHAVVKFLYGSACRPVEAMRLTWADVHDDHVVVWSTKGASKHQRRRLIPFELCPDVRDAIDMARGASWSGTDLVFGTTYYVKTSEAFNAALGADIGRGLYDIRKAAINRWKRAGWPEEVRHAIAGHEKGIAERHYETPYTAHELASIVQASASENAVRRRRK